MGIALEKRPGSAMGGPQESPGKGGFGLEITVLFTGIEETLGVLRKAAILARRLSARITLLVPQIVPYPLSIGTPPVLLDFNERRFRAIARDSPVETRVQIVLCRNRWAALMQTLTPGSLVVMARRRRWWGAAENETAAALTRAGHQVVMMETQ